MRRSNLLASNTVASIVSAALWSGAVVSMGEVLNAFVDLWDFVADMAEMTLAHRVTAIVNTKPQMNCFRGAKVCSKWPQERIDDHNIHSNNKYKNGLKVRIQKLVRYACVVTLHDYTTDTNDDMTTMTVFHTEHINTNT